MDPTQLQTDGENDSNSLEGAGTQPVISSGTPETFSSSSSLETNQQPPVAPNDSSTPPAGVDSSSSAPAGRPDSGVPMPPKKSFFKRLWAHFNIYLLLFILVILVAVGVVVVLAVKSKNVATTNQNALNSQSLSQSTLSQLANTDSTVGSPKQTLNIQSNAVFAGGVLVRSNLEVAGTLKVGGDLALPGITVSGNSRLGEVQANDLTLAGSENVQGVLTARAGLSVTGNSTFSGNVSATQLTTTTFQLNGNLVLTHHITAGGAIPGFAKGSALGAGGTSSISGSDTSGTITINTGSGAPAGCFATVTFATPFTGTPHVLVTPVGSSGAGLAYYVNRSSTDFSLCSATPPPSGASFGFDYLVLN